MKNIIFLILFLVLGFNVSCQVPNRAEMKKEVSNHVAKTNKAADVFLNGNLSDGERIKAISPYPFIYEKKQIQGFKKVILNNKESTEVRAMALNKIYQEVEKDKRFFGQILELFSNPKTKDPLRTESMNVLSSMSFSSLIEIPEVYKRMVNDPDERFRAFVISKLLISGDARTQQLIIKGLEDPNSALLPTVKAIELLSMTPKKEYHPAVFRLLETTKDAEVRLSAIKVLGPYEPAKTKLISITRDSQEKEPFRIAALNALYSGDRENVIEYITPILNDKSASNNLKITGIQISINIRQNLVHRANAKRADNYDLLIKSIAEDKDSINSENLKMIANKYIMLVRPKF